MGFELIAKDVSMLEISKGLKICYSRAEKIKNLLKNDKIVSDKTN